MSKLRKPSAILFDFDGVIIDTEWPIYETWKRFFEANGQTLAPEIYVQCIGSDFETWSPENYLEELTGLKFDWPLINAMRQDEIELALRDVKAVPGFLEALDVLDEKQIPYAVVSSSTHSWVDRWLDHLGVRDRFKAVVCRGDAPKIKPAPDLYLEAAHQLSLPPSDCLVVEDSKNGMFAAKAAGIPVVVIPSRLTSCIDFSEADLILKEMSLLNSLI